MLLFECIIPDLRTRSEANTHQHWSTRYKRAKTQKKWVLWAMAACKIYAEDYLIELTRIAPRELDYDNLVSSMKFIRDAVCDHLNPGRAPGQSDRGVMCQYKQEKRAPKEYGVIIRIFSRG